MFDPLTETDLSGGSREGRGDDTCAGAGGFHHRGGFDGISWSVPPSGYPATKCICRDPSPPPAVPFRLSVRIKCPSHSLTSSASFLRSGWLVFERFRRHLTTRSLPSLSLSSLSLAYFPSLPVSIFLALTLPRLSSLHSPFTVVALFVNVIVPHVVFERSFSENRAARPSPAGVRAPCGW